ncbi:MAG: Holliday junction branch migration protein RuvA [Dermatophilaceae bacterium]
MIATVRGEVARVGLDHVVVEVGGVGLHVHTTPGTAATLKAGAACELATSLVVREDSLTLYGFEHDEAKTLFETVQKVSGVGPRLALAMLAVHSPDALRAAVSSGDTRTLTRVPGIGTKGAERLVLELRDKLGGPPANAGAAAGSTEPGWQTQVRDALVGLGWSAKQADDAVEAVAPQVGPDTTVSTLLRAALQKLARS